MGNLKKVTKDEIEKIAEEHNIDESLIRGVINYLEEYLKYYYDSFQEFKKLPFPKYDDLPWSKAPKKEWAKLSLIFHANKKEIELPEPKIFDKSTFIQSKGFKESTILSEFVTNHIMKTYLEKMANENLLFDQDKAKEIMDFEIKRGKRPQNTTTKRNEMIKLASDFLRENGITEYSPVVRSIIIQYGFKKLSKASIRGIANSPF